MSNAANANIIDDTHPLSLFLSMLNSSESKRQYPKRLQHFFNFLKLEGDLQDQSLKFVKEFKNKDDEGEELEGRLIAFARFQKDRVAKKEVSPSTVPNYFKAVKLFCQANRISKNIEWKNISKAMPRGLDAADDRAPTLEEIQKLLEFPDRRIKPLVLTLVSSGIRIGAFETLKWKHITPISKNNDIVAAKILVYAGDREQYYSFLTPEAYNALKDWINYRFACGENITKDSLVMRDIWQNGDTEGATNPTPLNQAAITRLLNRAWQAQKIRPKLQKGEKRHEFKTAHGFRKYFKTQAEQARIPSIKIEMLMGHSLGVTDSYARFTEEEMLEDYLLGIDHLTVNQNLVMISKNFRKQQEYMQNSFKDLEEKHKKEIDDLRKEHHEYARLSEKQELDLTRGVNMLDKKLKHQENINQQLKNIFTILVEEIGFDNLTKIENTSERFLSALKTYVTNNPE